ncbi:MAG TPA: Gfo/Idh/MocA family oxidoreductase [Acidobacteriota bacterium]|nr:Gfo/Idh/MocA family oxidoreductase [Acidobacteriota bacterium]
MEIQVAVVGAGVLGRHHARIYSDIEDCKLEAVVDVRPERAQEVGRAFGCRALSDFRELPESVEAVSLATPTATHAEVGTLLLESGRHLLVEKPLASELAGADQLIRTAQQTDRILHVGHSERFNPALLAVRPYITAPRFFETHRMGVFAPRSLDIDVVLDLMIHDIDLLLWLVGQPIRDIRAVGIPVLTPRVDIANARIEFSDGCVANVTASRVSRERIRKMRFFQPHDYVSIDFHNRAVEMYSLVENDGVPSIVERTHDVSEAEPLRAELEAFLESVRGQAAPISCTGPEGREALSVALDILQTIGA